MYFKGYTPTGLLLLPLVTLVFVGSAFGQTIPNHLAPEQSRYLNRAMSQPVEWYPCCADTFKRARKKLTYIAMLQGLKWKSESAGKGLPPVAINRKSSDFRPIGTLAVELLDNLNVLVGAVSAPELAGKSSVFV